MTRLKMTDYGPFSELIAALTYPLEKMVALSAGPQTGRLRLTPTETGYRAVLDGLKGTPNAFVVVQPPWHPFDLLLANRGVGGRVPDKTRYHELAVNTIRETEAYIRLVSVTMGWTRAQTWVMYHLVTAIHANATLQEDACVTLRDRLYEGVGVDPLRARDAVAHARRDYTLPTFRPFFWGQDVYGEVIL